MEPMTRVNFPSYCNKLGFQNGIANATNKIWVFWDHSFSGSILRDSDQIIDVECSSTVFPSKFIASFVYAKSTRIERRTLWDELRAVSNLFDHKPWLVGGYFNCFLTEDERIGSNTDRHLDMEEFGQMVSDSGLIDIGYEGDNMHTWTRSGLQERLDRIFINHTWADNFPKSAVNHLPRANSDHAPLFCHVYLSVNKPPVTFRYMNMWTRHHTFLDTVSNVWTAPTGLNGFLNLHCKLQRVKNKLIWWNKNVFGNIFDKLSEAHSKVAAAEKEYDSNPSPNLLAALNHVKAKLVLATRIEEDFWHKKSSCKWIIEGDRNTKYFHNLVKQKRVRSRIHSITEGGNTFTSDVDIQRSCIQFFTDYMANDTICHEFDCDFPIPTIPNSIDLIQLCNPPDEDEVQKADWNICSKFTIFSYYKTREAFPYLILHIR
ncbi:hypothetical protein DH2020_038080 [Rehmannia glutinosa]|uniref:Uncharacterized protein n=1 Tax=Rehmannia glutinosa TaxID=99300 RepID=A0ABR0V0V1_REHGL